MDARCVVSTLAVAVAGVFSLQFSAPVRAIDPTIQVVSGSSAAEVRRPVALTSARFDIATRTLIATTRAANFVCGANTTTGGTNLKLRLDGVSYPIAVSALPGTLAAPIEYLASTVTMALGLQGGSGTISCNSSHAISNGLGLTFQGQRRLPVAEAVFFDFPSRTFQVRVAEPVLCESYVTLGPSSGLALRLNDSNAPLFNVSTAKLLPGLASLDYVLPGFTLMPRPQVEELTPRVQCSVPGSTVTPSAGGGSGDAIFGSGFEPLSLLDDPSEVTVSLLNIGSGTAGNNERTTGALPGGALQYTVRIVNDGVAAAANVRLREFVTGPNAIAQSGQPSPAQVLAGESGSSTCVRIGGAGACPAFGFPISLDVASIPVGQGFEFTLTRVVTGSASPGQRARMGFAAFVDPSAGGPDSNLSNNAAWLAADVISNQAPTVSAIGGQTMIEDGNPLVIPFTVTDPEMNPILTPTTNSNNATLLPPGSLQIAGSSGSYTLTITPAAQKNGLANVQVLATDGNSAPVVRQFQLTVTAVNDPPEFTLNVAGGEIIAIEGAGGCAGSQCNASVSNFVTNLLPGPAAATDESGQTVRPNTLADSFGDQRLLLAACQPAAVNPVSPSTFFVDGLMPRVIEPSPGVFNLVAQLARVSGAVDCAITVIDNGAPAAVSASQTLRIRYQP